MSSVGESSKLHEQNLNKAGKARPSLVEASVILEYAELLTAEIRDKGKAPRLSLIDRDFVIGMARVMEFGLRSPGRSPDGWKNIPHAQAVADFTDAFLRHVLEQFSDMTRLVEVEDSHEDALLHVATNAMILRYHLRKLKEESEHGETKSQKSRTSRA